MDHGAALDQLTALDSRAISILKLANGKRNYKEIASTLKMSPTTVSSVLSLAKKLEVANGSAGTYKKIRGFSTITKSIKKKKTPIQTVAPTRIPRPPNITDKFPSIKPHSMAGKMSQLYWFLFNAENSCRELVAECLNDRADWYLTYVPKPIREEINERKIKEGATAFPRNSDLDYTHLGELKQIIINNALWPKFGAKLKIDRDNLSRRFDDVMPIRNQIGHCAACPNDQVQFYLTHLRDLQNALTQRKN